MSNISRVTVTYSEAEDRIELACEIDSGETRVLMLTRRLCDRLVEAILTRLDRPGSRDPLAGRAIEAWALSAARAELVPENPVRADGAFRSLVSSVDIRQDGEYFQLLFRWHENGEAALNLDAVFVRQWLSIVHDAYLRAAWHSGIWPEWFDPALAGQALRSGRALH